MKISEFLKARRQELRISQADLASRLTLRGQDTLKASIGHWETERSNPPIRDYEFRLALASALEMDVNEMMAVLGFIIADTDRSTDARRAADIIDRLPSDARSLALDYLSMLEKRFAETG